MEVVSQQDALQDMGAPPNPGCWPGQHKGTRPKVALGRVCEHKGLGSGSVGWIDSAGTRDSVWG